MVFKHKVYCKLLRNGTAIRLKITHISNKLSGMWLEYVQFELHPSYTLNDLYS